LDPHNSDIRSSFKSEHCCVLIPTYNNSATLKNVIENVSLYTDNIIVVNDGSTDSTEEILRSFPGLDVLSYSPNKGKGIALRKGLKYAYNKGFQYAISIDSDGQHFAEDLFKFIEKLKEEKNSIIIGARNMDQASVPGKSSFGNKFSNFWFKLETGVTAPDTQSGYRLYPLKPLSAINFITRKFEFEIEVLVRASWKGVKISHVPVRVYYAPPAERVSHFRPFKDFTRIFLLNTVLVILAVLYYIPKRLLDDFQKKSFKQVINDYILDGDESNLRKSFSIALGIFIGIVPIWGGEML
jgi:glycosyltransferase involved in cell wall biosynthesis